MRRVLRWLGDRRETVQDALVVVVVVAGVLAFVLMGWR